MSQYYPFNNSYSLSKIAYSDLSINIQSYLSGVEYQQERMIERAFLINLDRSVDRLERATSHLIKADFPFDRFEAVDGFKLDIINKETGDSINGDKLYKTIVKTISNIEYEITYSHEEVGDISYQFSGSLSAGELGVTASHIAIWQEAIKQEYEYIIIFEDDVTVVDHKNFGKQVQNFLDYLPTNFDVGFLDCHVVNGQIYEMPNNPYVLAVSEDLMAWGTHAAVYSNQGMRKLISTHFTEAVDINIWIESSTLGEGLKVYVAEEKIASIYDSDYHSMTSTINNMGRYDPVATSNHNNMCFYDDLNI